MRNLRKRRVNLKIKLKFKDIIPLLILFLVFSSFLIYSFIPPFVFIKKGTTLTKDLKSPTEIEIIDREKTEELIKKAVESVPVLYEYDPDVEKDAINNLNSLFKYLEKWRNGDKKAQEEIFKDLGITFPKEYLEYFSRIDEEEFNKIKSTSVALLSYLFHSGIKEEDLPNIDTRIENFLSGQKINEIERYYIVTTIKPFSIFIITGFTLLLASSLLFSVSSALILRLAFIKGFIVVTM